jgi:hypothetical protein
MMMISSKSNIVGRLALATAGVGLACVGVVGATGGAGMHRAPPGPCTVVTAAGSQAQDARRQDAPAAGEGGARQGTQAAPPRSGRGPMAPFDFGWGGAKNRDLRAPSQREWEDVQAFMNVYSPRRQAAVDRLPEDDKKESIKKFVFARFRSLQALKKRDRASYEQRLAQLATEDEIFGLVHQWGGGAGDPDADRKQLREALRPQVASLVDLDIQERRRRVDLLKKELAEQSAQLEQDEKDRDGVVDRRVARFADWAERWAARRARQDDMGDVPRADVPASKPEPPAEGPKRE